MAYRAKGTQYKERFTLERVQSFPPAARVASLVNISEKPELIPLSTPFEKMNFLKGVFSRAYEEFHHLDLELARQAGSYLMMEFAKSHSISSIAAQISPAVTLIDQMKIPDWAARENSIASEFLDPMEAARKAALGDSSYYLDQQLASSNWVEEAAKGFPSNTIESAASELSKSEDAHKAAMWASLNDTAEQLANPVDPQKLLSDNGLSKPSREMPLPAPYEFDDHSSHPVKFLQDERKRYQDEREKQRARDEYLERQTKNSEELLEIKKQEAIKSRRLKPLKIIMGIISVISGIGGLIAFL